MGARDNPTACTIIPYAHPTIVLATPIWSALADYKRAVVWFATPPTHTENPCLWAAVAIKPFSCAFFQILCMLLSSISKRVTRTGFLLPDSLFSFSPPQSLLPSRQPGRGSQPGEYASEHKRFPVVPNHIGLRAGRIVWVEFRPHTSG